MPADTFDAEPDLIFVYAEVRPLRERAGMTADDLAEWVGCGTSLVADIERGDVPWHAERSVRNDGRSSRVPLFPPAVQAKMSLPWRQAVARLRERGLAKDC